MAEVTIQINANLEAAKRQVEELRQKLAEMVKISPTPAAQVAQAVPPNVLQSLTQYNQQVSQLTNQIRQLQAEMSKLAGNMSGQAGTPGFFSRVRGMFVSRASGGTSPNPTQVNHASVLMFDTPQQVAQFLRSAGFNFTGRETQTLAGIGARLAEGKPIPAQSISALSSIVEKWQSQADKLAEQLLEQKKSLGLLGQTEAGKRILSEIDKKFSALDTIAEYMQMLENEAMRGGGSSSDTPSGGGRFPGWLRTGAGMALGGLRSALGPAAVMFGLGALGYGTYEYMATLQAAGELGMRLGILSAPGSTRALVSQLTGLGTQAGYYTAQQMAQIASTQGLYGGRAGTWGQFSRDITTTGQFARAFGMDANQAAQVMGVYRQVGGYTPGQEEKLANAIANALQQSGIDPRQFLQANQMLVQTLAQQVGNVDVKQTARLQAVLDQLGNQYGYTSLVGTRGAQMLTELSQGIAHPGGGMFGEYTWLKAIEKERGISLPQAMWEQRKGLGAFKTNRQLLGGLHDIWEQAMKFAGGNQYTAMGFFSDLTGITNPDQVEELRKVTHDFTMLPTIKDKSGKTETLQDLIKSWQKSGASTTAQTIDNLNIGALTIGKITLPAAEAASKAVAQHPWATLGVGALGTLGAARGIWGILGKIFGKFPGGSGGAGGIAEGLGKLGEESLSETESLGGKALPKLLGRSGGLLAAIIQLLTGNRRKVSTWFGAGGTWLGGEAGAAAGSAILPGAGTVIGGVLGAIAGSVGGGKLGNEIDRSNVLQKIKEGISQLGQDFQRGFQAFSSLVPVAYNTPGGFSPGGYALAGYVSYQTSPFMLASYLMGRGTSGGGTGDNGPTVTPADYNPPSGVSDFVQRMYPIAQQVSAQTGLPPTLLLAQWGLESAWGTSQVARENLNFGGIKAYRGYPWGMGKDAPYAGFSSLEDFGKGVAYFYLHNSNYQKLLSDARKGVSPQTLIRDLAASGYAQDPNYAAEIESVLKTLANVNIPTTDKKNQGAKVVITFVPDNGSPVNAPGVAYA